MDPQQLQDKIQKTKEAIPIQDAQNEALRLRDWKTAAAKIGEIESKLSYHDYSERAYLLFLQHDYYGMVAELQAFRNKMLPRSDFDDSYKIFFAYGLAKTGNEAEADQITLQIHQRMEARIRKDPEKEAGYFPPYRLTSDDHAGKWPLLLIRLAEQQVQAIDMGETEETVNALYDEAAAAGSKNASVLIMCAAHYIDFHQHDKALEAARQAYRVGNEAERAWLMKNGFIVTSEDPKWAFKGL